MTTDAALEVIHQQLLDDRAALRAAVDRIPPAQRHVRPAPDRWSCAEVIEHVAIVETRTASAMGTLVASAPTQDHNTPTPFDRSKVLDRSTRATAPDFIQPQGKQHFAAAWAALESAWKSIDALMDSYAGRDFTKISREHPFLGHLDGYQWLNSMGGHERRHAAQILEIAEALAGR